jgi:RND family efflux transporter MFP subunit
VDVAKVALADYRISSPIDGVVTTRSAEPGMLAAPGMALMAIEDSKHYELQVTVEESQISRLRTGQRAAVRVDSLPQTIQGQLIRTNPVANEATRTYAVTLSLALPGGEAPLRTGSFGRATFILGNEDGVVIPESALVERGQLTGVFYVRDNLALFRLVKSGRRHESGIQILSGLSAGDRILLRPDPGLPDGTRILENNLPGTSQ